MFKIFIVTERRADFSRFDPIIKIIQKDKKLDYQLVVTGIHLMNEYGYTINEIKKKKYKIYKNFKIFNKKYLKINDGAEMANSLGKATSELSKILTKSKPDLILSGFDIAANLAVTICGAHMNIPVAHIQGGEVSGNIDESIRHAMSKFSNFHFTANNETKKRLIRMGEVPKNIFPVGCPSIDALKNEKKVNRLKILKNFGIDMKKKYLLIIQHPVTSELHNSSNQFAETIAALKKMKLQHLIIFPNNDAGSVKIVKLIRKSKLNFVRSLDLKEYKTLLQSCSALIGNSSSGIHEAASFKVPVVNIGTRQQGRFKPKNVISVGYSRNKIYFAIKKALSNKFNKKIKKIKNPYGDGNSAKKIVSIIKRLNLKNFNTQKQITY